MIQRIVLILFLIKHVVYLSYAFNRLNEQKIHYKYSLPNKEVRGFLYHDSVSKWNIFLKEQSNFTYDSSQGNFILIGNVNYLSNFEMAFNYVLEFDNRFEHNRVIMYQDNIAKIESVQLTTVFNPYQEIAIVNSPQGVFINMNPLTQVLRKYFTLNRDFLTSKGYNNSHFELLERSEILAIWNLPRCTNNEYQVLFGYAFDQIEQKGFHFITDLGMDVSELLKYVPN